MTKNQPLSIVVPTLNEVGNIPALLSRIDTSLESADINYEVIIIDDHSTDGTIKAANDLAHKYPVRTYLKSGIRGKAHSLLEGFSKATHDLVVMIDADLQYPPEKIAPMYNLMQDTNADVIVTKRIQKNVGVMRQLSTRIFNLIFARMLFGIRFDTQSGLKLFKKRILTKFTMNPSPWSFDMEFLVRSLENKYKIASLDIPFEERTSGSTKVHLLSTTFALAKASVGLRWKTSTSKLRAGYRANDIFLKRTLQRTGMIAVVLSAAFAIGSTSNASALSVSPAQYSTSSSLLGDILSPITNIFNGNTPEQAPDPVKTSTMPTSPDNPIPTTTPTAMATQETQPPAAASTETSTATPAGSLPLGQSGTNTVPIYNENDRRALSPATGTSVSNIYDSSYPNYTLNEDTTNQLLQSARIAWFIGAAILAVSLLFIGFNKLIKSSPKRLLIRS